jgi:hypothetical protein
MKHKVERTNQAGLADALAITDRRVRQLEDQGVLVRDFGGRYDVGFNRHRYRLFKTRDYHQAAIDIEQAARRAQDALDQIRAASGLNERRTLAPELGPAIGELYRAMKLCNALADEHERLLFATFTRMVVGRAVGELLSLCNWELADEPSRSAEDRRGR